VDPFASPASVPAPATTSGDHTNGTPAAAASRGGSVDAPGSPSRRKRLLAALITPTILLTAVVGGHGFWTWQAERRIDKFVAGLREGGEPVDMAAFAPAQPVPDGQNAAIDLRAAGEAIAPDTEAWQSFVNTGALGLPLTEHEMLVIGSVVEANAQVFNHVAVARTRPTVEWTGVLPTQGRMSISPWGQRGMGFFRQRGVAQLLFAAALASHQMGDEAAALDRIEDLMFLAQATAERPTLRAQVGAMRIHDVALATLSEIMPDLKVAAAAAAAKAPGKAAAANAGTGPATPARVRAMIATLLDEGEVRGSMIRGLRAERARHIEGVMTNGVLMRDPGALDAPPWADPLAIPAPSSRIEGFVSRPVHLARAQRALERFNVAIDAFTAAPDLREFLAAFPESGPGGFNEAGEAVADRGEDNYARLLTATIQQIGRMHYVSMARRRTAALALALRLYQAERGDWPAAELSALVPDYVAHVPTDPLSSSGEPLIFVPDEHRPRVYSVGEDGIDDGGWPPDPYASRPEDLRMTDWVVDLVRQPRVAPPIQRR
jgi:hypothetical protein